MKKPTQNRIPADIRRQAELLIASFNDKALGGTGIRYVPRFRGPYLFLDRSTGDRKARPICRLEYTGNLVAWKFAIFKYSDMVYDPGEFMFPGAEAFDGTLDSAMAAGLEAYAP